jgi:hypothetical protein
VEAAVEEVTVAQYLKQNEITATATANPRVKFYHINSIAGTTIDSSVVLVTLVLLCRSTFSGFRRAANEVCEDTHAEYITEDVALFGVLYDASFQTHTAERDRETNKQTERSALQFRMLSDRGAVMATQEQQRATSYGTAFSPIMF